ncbi:MAG: HlyD family efflux transporter periplasmic adaptor subunit [Planctomycetota bacterium]
MSDTQLDLKQLAYRRPAANPTGSSRRRGRWLVRYALPAAIMLGFLALLGVAAGRQLSPKKKVTVCPVIIKRGVVQRAGTPLFQAAGWIEPRPNAIAVAALSPGVIEELLVVEGQNVRKGDVIARLIAVDAELAVGQARATLAKTESGRDRVRAELKAAKSRLDHPLHLKLPLAEARGLLARSLTESERLPFLIQAAETKLQISQRNYEGKRRAGEAVSGLVLRQAEGELSADEAKLSELRARRPNLRREIEALEEKVLVLEEQLKLQIDDHGAVGEAEAKLNAAAAKCSQAELGLKRAELDLQRMQVTAPMDGRILRVIATPGTRVIGEAGTTGQNAGAVVEMYDPATLQIRADVRLEDVPLVTSGAPVQIKTASSNQVLKAVVLQPTSKANIQKNTLEVKVALSDAPDTVRPDMLVTATFLAPQIAVEPRKEKETMRILIPGQLVNREVDESDAGTSVVATTWIVDPEQRASRRTIHLGLMQAGGLVEVTRGLEATDKLIASDTSDLEEGDRLAITGDDDSLGVGR